VRVGGGGSSWVALVIQLAFRSIGRPLNADGPLHELEDRGVDPSTAWLLWGEAPRPPAGSARSPGSGRQDFAEYPVVVAGRAAATDACAHDLGELRQEVVVAAGVGVVLIETVLSVRVSAPFFAANPSSANQKRRNRAT